MKSTWMQNPDGIKTEKKKNCIAAAGLKRRKLDAVFCCMKLPEARPTCLELPGARPTCLKLPEARPTCLELPEKRQAVSSI